MRGIFFLRGCFIVFCLCLCSTVATAVSEPDIERAYVHYRANVYPQAVQDSRNTPLESISPAVGFASWYFQSLHEKTPKIASDILYRILYEGYGVGGISKTRLATPTEKAIMLTLGKKAIPLSTTSLGKTGDLIEIAHRTALDSAMRILNSPDTNPTIKGWTDALDWTVSMAGLSGKANYTDKLEITRGINMNVILYEALLSDPKADPSLILKRHPQIKECLTDFNGRFSALIQTITNYPPAREAIFNALTPEAKFALALTSKHAHAARNLEQKEITFRKRKFPSQVEILMIKEKFPRWDSLEFIDIDFSNRAHQSSLLDLISSQKITRLCFESCIGIEENIWVRLIAHPCLQILELNHCNIGPKGEKALAEKLPRTLQGLTLRDKVIGHDTARLLINNLPPTLKILNLRGNEIGLDGAKALANHIPPDLKQLDLSNCGIGLDSIKVLANRLPQTLQKLALYGCRMGDEGVLVLAGYLPQTLQMLDIGCNWVIGPNSISTLVRHLSENLQILNLSYCGVGSHGIRTLAGYLPVNLQQLFLDRNGIGDVGAMVLAGRLPHTLQILDLRSNLFGPDGAKALAGHLPATLKILYLGYNPFRDDGIKALMSNLPPDLKQLDLSNCGVDTDSIRPLAKLFPQSLQITYAEAIPDDL